MRERASPAFASGTQRQVWCGFCADRIILPHTLFCLVRTRRFCRRLRCRIGKCNPHTDKNKRENYSPAHGNSTLCALPHLQDSNFWHPCPQTRLRRYYGWQASLGSVGGGTVGPWFGGPPLGGFRGESHKLETPNVTPCNANASYADAP